jgi:DNA polymerase-3 subunit gamma/tau
MSYLVLARKYRPQTFDDVVKQDHVTRTLKNAIAARRVAHAILFTGPRGTGKTTVARILAKAMNCAQGPTATPCNACHSCKEITGGNAADVFEIDGASNNGVDHIRELRENARFMPQRSAYKIYIIDEVHMLSTPAFNALLKILEEPPEHVLFFFATTEPHKIPITIMSRCQRHDLRRIPIADITAHMADLCRREGMVIDEESLSLIARESGGSMRDALSLLDQVMSAAEGEITHGAVLDILGVADRRVLFDLSAALFRGDVPAVLAIIDDAHDHGQNLKTFYSDLVEHFRNLLVTKMGRDSERLVDVPAHEREWLAEQVRELSEIYLSRMVDTLLKEETAIKFSIQAKIALEMAVIRMFQVKPALPIEDLIRKLDLLRGEMGSAPANTVPTPVQRPAQPETPAPESYRTRPQPAASVQESSEPEPLPVQAAPGPAPGAEPPAASDPAPKPAAVFDPAESEEEIWGKLVACVCEEAPSVGGSLSKCRLVAMTDDGLTIEAPDNGFNLKQLKRKHDKIKAACDQFFCKEMTLEVRAGDGDGASRREKVNRTEQIRQEALDHPLVAAALEIFQGKLVDIDILDGKQGG